MIRKIKDHPFIWNSVVLFSGTMLVNILNYLFHFIVGRMVTAEVYGEIESLVSLLTIVSVPAAAIGIIATKYSAKMKLVSDEQGSFALFRYLNKKIVLFGVPLLLVAFALTPVIKNFLNIQSSIPLFFVWMMMFLSFLGAVSSGILSGWQKFTSLNAVGIWGALAKFILGISLIRIGFFVNGAVGSFLAAGVVSYGVSLLCLKFILVHKEKNVDAQIIDTLDTETIKQSVLPTFIGILAITLLGNVDMIFAKHALDPIAAGEYSALSIVAKTIFFVTGVITSVLFAMTAGESQRSETSLTTFKQAAVITLIIGLGSVSFFSIFQKFVLGMFFGVKYLHVSDVLVWFALMASLYSIANLFVQYLLSLHQTKVMKWFLIGAIIEVAALYFFGKSLYTIVIIATVMQIITMVVGFFFIRNAVKS